MRINNTFKIKNRDKIFSIKTNSRQAKYSFYMSHEQRKSDNVLIQCSCNALISSPVVCRVPSEYQQLLDTSVVRLNPGTISNNSKKSRLYSQVFCCEVFLKHSLQMGDLVLVLEL